MATDLKNGQDTSVTALVSGIVRDAQELTRQQFELFKLEVKNDLRKTRDAGLLVAGGGAVCAVATVLLALMFVELLRWAVPELPLWSCYGICGVVLAIAGAGLIWAGKAKFESFHLLRDESAQALKENVQWITNQK
jgi:hypothetical protein